MLFHTTAVGESEIALAAESMASGWRLKPLHRMIILSQTYQRSSAFQPDAATLDPDNATLWRHRQRRLEAEVIRDSILAVSGQLSNRMAGPGFYPTLPMAVLEGQSQPGLGWGKSDKGEQARRSVYIFAKRSLGVPEGTVKARLFRGREILHSKLSQLLTGYCLEEA